MQSLPPQPPPKHTQTLAALLPMETANGSQAALGFPGF